MILLVNVSEAHAGGEHSLAFGRAKIDGLIDIFPEDGAIDEACDFVFMLGHH